MLFWSYLSAPSLAASGFHLTPRRLLCNDSLLTERQKRQIQDEIHGLELKESTLTGVQRTRQIATELGMVEPTEASQVVWDR